MPNQRLITFRDCVEHLLDYTGGGTDEINLRRARRAVLNAYREVSNARPWHYYFRLGKINTVASYSTGTVAYDHTGGSNERELTLTSGTWPDWAGLGTVLVDNVPYDVAARVSATVLTLSVNNNPGADVAAGTSYQIFQDTYQLPGDFKSCGEMVNSTTAGTIPYIQPDEWPGLHRSLRAPAMPSHFTITSDPRYHGVLAVRFGPPPSSTWRYDFVYRRKPRDLVTENYSTGTVTVNSASTTVTGTGTAWTTAMEGAVIRFSGDGTNLPTSPAGGPGGEPAVVERIITDVASATSLTIDAVPGQTLTAVKYLISDPIDIEMESMQNYLLRECERQVRIGTKYQPTAFEEELHKLAMMQAFEADNRATEPRWSGSGRRAWPRVDDFPAAAALRTSLP